MKADMNMTYVLLMNEDETIKLQIGFFGFTKEQIEEYLQKTYVNSDKQYAKRYTKLEYFL